MGGREEGRRKGQLELPGGRNGLLDLLRSDIPSRSSITGMIQAPSTSLIYSKVEKDSDEEETTHSNSSHLWISDTNLLFSYSSPINSSPRLSIPILTSAV